MNITRLETFLTNAGLRNYLFIRLTTDTGLTGLGEASLEWQEQTVQTIIHEWVEDRVMGIDPFDVEAVIGGLIRDQYQGGSTVMTAISGVEIACWDLIGKACGQPVYRLLGGRCHDRLFAYANGWYGGARTPQEYADRAREAVARGYRGLKFDPFGTAWKEMSRAEMSDTERLVAAVRDAAGPDIDLMIEVHGRLSAGCAIEIGRRLEPYRPAWYEEPVTPNSLELLKEVKAALPFPIAAGERLYTLQDFYRLTVLRAADIVQMDPAHCGGLLMTKKIAGMAGTQDMNVSPHCSIGPVALCAALHVDWSTPNVIIQENFAEYDVPWRNDLVCGWSPIRHGEFLLPEKPGLGLELDTEVCAEHPYKKNSFPSLWDQRWLRDFTQNR
ncbi:MAG: mandelate racemase/muconate lactonizing enzyme family protein [Candidatus Latescibacteria bacterium]|nr:mandelate racemase/muconate lactonizing enzyme family protein [Candidatus Latescibacterota bacterium]